MGKHLIFTLVSLSSPMCCPHQIFNQIQDPNIFTWNTMIRGYAESENPRPAIDLHHKMQLNSIEPDTHTYPFLLKAIAKLLAVREGERVHSVVVKNGFESLVFVQNTLVHMYAACGRAESAHKLFVLMPDRNLVTWNSVINGFALNGKPSETLRLYREMRLEDVEPDGFTVVSLLTACAELGALALGKATIDMLVDSLSMRLALRFLSKSYSSGIDPSTCMLLLRNVHCLGYEGETRAT
ncbi:hypothetical protein RJ639_027406 [Escallonia herrerae]|uniref:Pentatricopeptide repeat-containing protein n=1 Tax=Escallonia herrerae TaxID=1293975 RepID=A0AA89BDT3_9ASTE|nr:hypothetical protein RJ639_027406 [Escallonia herrerae]